MMVYMKGIPPPCRRAMRGVGRGSRQRPEHYDFLPRNQKDTAAMGVKQRQKKRAITQLLKVEDLFNTKDTWPNLASYGRRLVDSGRRFADTARSVNQVAILICWQSDRKVRHTGKGLTCAFLLIATQANTL
eukprot:s2020_g6.t1